MLIIKNPLTLKEIEKNHNHFFSEMVKIVVDIEQETIALDTELHADLEQELLEKGSKQENLWGANIYFDKPQDEFIEYTSLINIRPAQNNKNMEVLNSKVKEKMKKIINKLIIN